jgi:hypothetical protein
MLLGDVEETTTSVEVDDETYEEIIKVCVCVCHRKGREECVLCCARAVCACCVHAHVPLPTPVLPPRRVCAARARVRGPSAAMALPAVGRPQTQKRSVPFLFLRGDGVILISPPLRS